MKRDINKIKNNLKNIHPDLRVRLKNYCALLDEIIDEYFSAKFLPEIPRFGLDQGDNIDLFRWARDEIKAKHKKKLHRRIKVLQEIRSEMRSILEYAKVLEEEEEILRSS